MPVLGDRTTNNVQRTVSATQKAMDQATAVTRPGTLESNFKSPAEILGLVDMEPKLDSHGRPAYEYGAILEDIDEEDEISSSTGIQETDNEDFGDENVIPTTGSSIAGSLTVMQITPGHQVQLPLQELNGDRGEQESLKKEMFAPTGLLGDDDCDVELEEVTDYSDAFSNSGASVQTSPFHVEEEKEPELQNIQKHNTPTQTYSFEISPQRSRVRSHSISGISMASSTTSRIRRLREVGELQSQIEVEYTEGPHKDFIEGTGLLMATMSPKTDDKQPAREVAVQTNVEVVDYEIEEELDFDRGADILQRLKEVENWEEENEQETALLSKIETLQTALHDAERKMDDSQNTLSNTIAALREEIQIREQLESDHFFTMALTLKFQALAVNEEVNDINVQELYEKAVSRGLPRSSWARYLDDFMRNRRDWS
eukprot:Clim_evm9s109 gene=Clim_evmTU9s109